jgi:hypothetical protein
MPRGEGAVFKGAALLQIVGAKSLKFGAKSPLLARSCS